MNAAASELLNNPVSLYPHKSSVVMDTLNKLGWVKHFNPAMKGQFYFMPRGTIVFNTMADFLKNWVKKELGAMEIRTPVIYDFNDSSIQAESAQFADRTFQVDINNKLGVLRPGGDYGVMSILSKQKFLHENHLPIKLFELVSSFRKNQTRELTGLLRAHTFTLLDSHFYLRSTDEAWDWYIAIILAQAKLADFFHFKWDLSLDIQSGFFDDHSDALNRLKDQTGKDVNIRKIENATNYWTMQHYLVDSRNHIGFCDGQYDLVNAKNYNITYLNRDGKNYIHPVICHASFGSVERWIYKLVHNAISSKGLDFPVWLVPSHIRFINDKINTMDAIVKDANHFGIRTEIDARNKSVSDKVKCAAAEWVPYTIIMKDDNVHEVSVIDLQGRQTKTSLAAIFQEIESKITTANRSISVDLGSIINSPSLR